MNPPKTLALTEDVIAQLGLVIGEAQRPHVQERTQQAARKLFHTIATILAADKRIVK